tara:strand:- start:10 stop:543 length:534 start_codon:yes stop_codon:yes gene_type:complete
MVTRPNKSTPQLKFVSWAIRPQYTDGNDNFTFTAPEDQQTMADAMMTLKPGVKEAEDAQFKQIIDKNFFLNDRPTGQRSPHPTVNLENLSKSLLNQPKIQRAWSRMVRLLRTEAIPQYQAGFVFEQRWQVVPTPEGTPPGKVWQFWTRLSSSHDNPSPQLFAWMLVQEQREDFKGGS